MLTVKVYDDSGVRAGYNCDSYAFVPAYPVGPGVPDAPAIKLMDADGDLRTVIRPTDATVYVMNDAGKTVDTIRFAGGAHKTGSQRQDVAA